MTFLSDLLKLGDTAVPSELPSDAQLSRVVASLVKVLEHDGMTVAEELFPELDAVSAAAAAAPAVTEDARKSLEDLVARMERAAAKLDHHTDDEKTEPEPVSPPPGWTSSTPPSPSPMGAGPAAPGEDPAS
jgi:hypothetical protein